jgi:hypothetical protein
MRTLTFAALTAALLAAAFPARAGWSVVTGEGTAALFFGKPENAGAFRMDCSETGVSLSTWTRSLPRNVTKGEFPTRLSVFQGNREILIGSTGRVLPSGGTRIDGLLDNAPAFLDGIARNSRFVVVSFAGRATAPAPAADMLFRFRNACPKGLPLLSPIRPRN